ncbi:MAG: metal-sensitive transcriptional regulator [Sphingomonadales bacterium]
MNPKTKKSCLSRLGRIEGQVRGISRMIEDDRYCIDIMTQLQAVKAALKRVEDEILREHVSHCIADAMENGDTAEKHQKIEELMEVVARLR